MTDEQWMRRALELAARALGTTAPNPPVGAVIARGDVVLGEGFTQPPGGAHAEVMALADCEARGNDPRGATMIVTLEPCCHHGRTPPCTDAILAAGIGRVVVGVVDPFPAMCGRSIELLRAAGVDVVLGVEAEACGRRVLGFSRATRFGLPEVTVKAGISADGHTATAAGESRWITSEPARAAAHRLRAEHDAVLVGIGTILADDPSLTTRHPDYPDRNAVPVVLDTELRTPSEARVLLSPRRAVLICADDAPIRDLRADLIRVPRGAGGHADAKAALQALCARGLHRVLVEGGGHVVRSLLDAHLVDTLELFVAPTLIPGGLPLVAGPPIERLAEAVPVRRIAAEPVGPDLRITYVLEHATARDRAGVGVR